MFRTITAKYNGTCKRCDQPITVGQKIRYGGYGRTYHLKADCAEQTDDAATPPTRNDYELFVAMHNPQPADAPPAETVIELDF